MSYLKHKPLNPFLHPYIEYYNSLVGNGVETKEFVSLPEGKIGLVFMLNGVSTEISTEEITPRENSHISGLIMNPTNYRLSKDIETFSVVFKPGSLYKFIPNIPINILALSSAGLNEVFGKEIYKLEDQLKGEPDFIQKIKLVEVFLLSKMKNYDQRINYAIKYIENHLENITVSDLGFQLNLGVRQLRNVFNNKIGLSPKQFIKLCRFKNSLLIPPTMNQNNAQYAAGLGYYDESHFIHDFKSFSGMTPKEYFKNQEHISDFSNYNRLYLR